MHFLKLLAINLNFFIMRDVLSQRVKNITPSATLGMNAKALELKRQGVDVISFSVGESDFDSPDSAKKGAIDAINDNFNRYTAVKGIPELLEAIQLKFKRENELDFELDEIMASNGGKQVLYTLFQAILDPGDEVLVPTPFWVSYDEMIKLADGVPVFVPMDSTFKLKASDLEGHFTDKTKAVLLNSPSNPTGAVIEWEELEKIAQICLEKDILIISDDVYEHFMYDGKSFRSLATISPEVKAITFIVNAISKTYGMAGWRLGYAAGPKAVIKSMTSFQSHAASNPCCIAQKAAIGVLTGPQDSVAAQREAFDERRNYIYEELNSIDGVECNKSEGAFYVFPNVSGLYKGDIKNSLDFAEALLTEAHIAVAPGSAFGGADECIRFSYATSMDNIKEGMKRFKEYVSKL
jgi:aspartate aminotransferase